MLRKEEFKRYQKQIMLDEIGINGQLKMKQAKIAVVGAGGLGCPILQYLSAVGIGTVGLIDFDTVDVSNLHRQVLYSENDIGKLKVEIASQKLKLQNPHTELILHPVMITEENAETLLANYDIVIDGCDNFMTRYIINDVCVKLNKPLVYGSILGYEGQIAVFNFNGSKNLRDIFPEAPDAEDVPSCSENGVLGTVPGIIGTMMAQEAIKLILNTNTLQNNLLLVNTMTWDILKVAY